MRALQIIYESIVNLFFTSADPNLFGSKKRRKEKEKLSNEFKGYAADIQSDIDIAKSANPFESAAAKSAMATSSRQAKQMQNRYANMLGGNTNPEAIIAAQGATQDAVAGTAGDIAVGSEALKQQQLAQLRGEKASMLGQSGAIKQSSIDERGSGWNTLFQGISAIGGGLEGISGAVKAFS